MADYDFKSLSSYDFALLARDLLQAHLGLQLESFTSGPDSGIDFRYHGEDTYLIVQCKHYAGSGFAALTNNLRCKERLKIDALAPTRYILATSIGLTPRRKDQIQRLLSPHVSQPADIYGREDLNNLLCRNSDIERRHFKLWLTSESVLRRVLDAGVFSDSEAHLDRIRLRLRQYVYNPSFDRARSILDQSHYCIIAGIPGIGKTTLAEVLLADLVDHHGYETFRIAHNLEEVRRLKNSKRKQVFYFDDFLGKTALEKLQKNEDQRLIELIEEVAENPDWRFILTTREYILNSAKFHYEAFAHPRVDFRLCVINLDDYTGPIRAKILYNHIYFSDLPKAQKLALLQNKGYVRIVRHRNYNPRVIEYMTQARHACAVVPSLYLNEFTDSLEHPARIWDHAFRYQISEAARHLLLVLSTLPDDVLLADLEVAFWTFYRFRQKRFGFSTRSGDWNDAMKEIDGSFVGTRKVGSDLVASFHSPSIRDFLEDFLSSSDGDVVDLVSAGHFYEQYVTLWDGRRGHRYAGVDHNRDEFLSQLEKKIFGPSASTIRIVHSDGEPIGLRHRTVSNEARAGFAVRVADDLKSAGGELFLSTIIAALVTQWEAGEADREDLTRLLQKLTGRGLRTEDRAFIVAKGCLAMRFEEIDDFRAFANFADSYPDEIPAGDFNQLKAKFQDFAIDYAAQYDDDDPDWLRQVAADLEYVGKRLDVNVDRLAERLEACASEIEQERRNGGPENDDTRAWELQSGSDNDIHEMFQSLREELED